MPVIEIPSYNVDEATKCIFLEVTRAYPQYGMEGIAKEMGISSRTLFRYMKAWNITRFKTSPFIVDAADEVLINELKRRGITIK